MPTLCPSDNLPVCRGGGTKRKDKESAKGFKKNNLGGPGKTPTSAQCEYLSRIAFSYGPFEIAWSAYNLIYLHLVLFRYSNYLHLLLSPIFFVSNYLCNSISASSDSSSLSSGTYLPTRYSLFFPIPLYFSAASSDQRRATPSRSDIAKRQSRSPFGFASPRDAIRACICLFCAVLIYPYFMILLQLRLLRT